MTENDFKNALAKAESDEDRMKIIVKNFNWSGIITPRDNVVATYYIAQALAALLEQKSD